MKETLAKYSALAKALVATLSTSLVAYGIYDAETMATIIGSGGALAAAFWTFYDVVVTKSKSKSDDQ